MGLNHRSSSNGRKASGHAGSDTQQSQDDAAEHPKYTGSVDCWRCISILQECQPSPELCRCPFQVWDAPPEVSDLF